MTERDEPVPDWVLNREADEGVPTVGMPQPVEEPSDLYLESQPWARYTVEGGLERFAALTILRAKRRRQGYEVPGIPWLTIMIVSVSACLLIGGLSLLAEWGWRSMSS